MAPKRPIRVERIPRYGRGCVWRSSATVANIDAASIWLTRKRFAYPDYFEAYRWRVVDTVFKTVYIWAVNELQVDSCQTH